MTNFKLVTQSYGIAMAQVTFGGPRGIWLECTTCLASHRIVNAPIDMPDKAAAVIFRKNGWTGKGQHMRNAKCPECSKKK